MTKVTSLPLVRGSVLTESTERGTVVAVAARGGAAGSALVVLLCFLSPLLARPLFLRAKLAAQASSANWRCPALRADVISVNGSSQTFLAAAHLSKLRRAHKILSGFRCAGLPACRLACEVEGLKGCHVRCTACSTETVAPSDALQHPALDCFRPWMTETHGIFQGPHGCSLCNCSINGVILGPRSSCDRVCKQDAPVLLPADDARRHVRRL